AAPATTHTSRSSSSSSARSGFGGGARTAPKGVAGGPRPEPRWGMPPRAVRADGSLELRGSDPVAGWRSTLTPRVQFHQRVECHDLHFHETVTDADSSLVIALAGPRAADPSR